MTGLPAWGIGAIPPIGMVACPISPAAGPSASANQVGWRLLTQTNHPNTGVSANPLDWDTVPGSTTNQVLIPVNSAARAGSYRLAYP